MGMALNKEERAEQKKERAKMNFMRSELTDAENYLNMARVQPFAINQYSIQNFNKQAVRDFQSHEKMSKVLNLVKPRYYHNKKLIKKLALYE